MKALLTIAAVLIAITAAQARYKPVVDARLKEVHTVFVSGNNPPAVEARLQLQKDSESGKGCLTLATNPKDADAIFDISGEATSSGGPMSVKDWTASGTLTLKSGDLIWSQSQRFSDAPFMSGGKTAGKLLYTFLRGSACGK